MVPSLDFGMPYLLPRSLEVENTTSDCEGGQEKIVVDEDAY